MLLFCLWLLLWLLLLAPGVCGVVCLCRFHHRQHNHRIVLEDEPDWTVLKQVRAATHRHQRSPPRVLQLQLLLCLVDRCYFRMTPLSSD